MHTNTIKNLSVSTYELKQTAVRFYVMAVLEGSSDSKKEGALSLYFLQWFIVFYLLLILTHKTRFPLLPQSSNVFGII